MNREQLTLIKGGELEPEKIAGPVPPEVQLRHLRNVTSSMLRSALKVWAEIYGELEGEVTHGLMVRPEARKGFVPRCGWPEFLEKMWRLERCLDQAKRICEGQG